MANTYTPNFRYRMPAIGDEFWADEFYQNQEIKDAVTKNHLVGAKVSGLLVTVNSGLSISWEAGQVFVNEIIHTVNSGSVVLPPSGNVDILVPVYIYTDGINVVVSTVVPTLLEGTLLAIADTDTQQIVALADTRVIGELFEQNDTFYVDVNGDDNASGSITEPWQTIQGSMNNISNKTFNISIFEVSLTLLSPFDLGTDELLIDRAFDIRPSFRLVGSSNNTISSSTTVSNKYIINISACPTTIIFDNLSIIGNDGTVKINGVHVSFSTLALTGTIIFDNLNRGIDASNSASIITKYETTNIRFYDTFTCIYLLSGSTCSSSSLYITAYYGVSTILSINNSTFYCSYIYVSDSLPTAIVSNDGGKITIYSIRELSGSTGIIDTLLAAYDMSSILVLSSTNISLLEVTQLAYANSMSNIELNSVNIQSPINTGPVANGVDGYYSSNYNSFIRIK